MGPVLGSPDVLETRIRKGPVQTVREYRPTLIKGVVSTLRSRPTEEASPETIHGVVQYVAAFSENGTYQEAPEVEGWNGVPSGAREKYVAVG